MPAKPIGLDCCVPTGAYAGSRSLVHQCSDRRDQDLTDFEWIELKQRWNAAKQKEFREMSKAHHPSNYTPRRVRRLRCLCRVPMNICPVHLDDVEVF